MPNYKTKLVLLFYEYDEDGIDKSRLFAFTRHHVLYGYPVKETTLLLPDNGNSRVEKYGREKFQIEKIYQDIVDGSFTLLSWKYVDYISPDIRNSCIETLLNELFKMGWDREDSIFDELYLDD